MQTLSKLALQGAIISTVLGGKMPRNMEEFDAAAGVADAFLSLFDPDRVELVEEIDPDSVLDGEEWELVSFSQVEHDHPKKFIYEHKVFGEVEITRPPSWRRG